MTLDKGLEPVTQCRWDRLRAITRQELKVGVSHLPLNLLILVAIENSHSVPGFGRINISISEKQEAIRIPYFCKLLNYFLILIAKKTWSSTRSQEGRAKDPLSATMQDKPCQGPGHGRAQALPLCSYPLEVTSRSSCPPSAPGKLREY